MFREIHPWDLSQNSKMKIPLHSQESLPEKLDIIDCIYPV